ncbi:protein NLRC3-like [Gigaspora margarita]|uniref:Protein NLRC3-like n=1 Tax=Gigaspora margarita TaxID=4874 RepID=A0A8H4AQJ7_GIGMA|nr:protein NLRC3-like [Gigaspora margarita]
MESSENFCNSVADVLCKNINLNSLDLFRNYHALMGEKALTKALYVNNTYNSAVDDGDNRRGFGKSTLSEHTYNSTVDDVENVLQNAIRCPLITRFLRPSKNIIYLKINGVIYKQIIKDFRKNSITMALELHNSILDSKRVKNLSQNYYGLMGGEALTKALYVNNTIIVLSMMINGVIYEQIIKDYCRSNIIMTLELHNSNLNSKGVKVLQEAIINNTTLTSLILWTSENLCNYIL